MTAAPPDIERFLKQIGLETLAERFAAEDIDLDVLRMLDAAELRELGLTMGQRKKIEAGLSALNVNPVSKDPTPTQPRGDEAPTPIQLRRLSVLFCDIVGSTSLGEELSIDQMQALLQHYYDTAHRVARDHDGYLSGTQGDGVVLLFGFPRVIEGIAERCIQAARALQTELAETPLEIDGHPPIYIPTRIGIATGQAAVGTTDGALSNDQMHLVGPVVNRAARLQAVARPGSIVVDAKTRELTEDHVIYSRAETHQLKGLAGEQAVSHVLGLGHSMTQAQAIDLVGRDGELQQLSHIWSIARSGTTQIVAVSGDAGIGKSALISAFLSRLGSDPTRIIELQSAAIAAQSPLWPVADFLDRTLSGLPPAQRPEALAGMLSLDENAKSDVAGLSRFLDLQSMGDLSGDTTNAARGESLALFTRWISQPGTAPTLLVLDNAQWADDFTKALLQQSTQAARAAGSALMVVSITRSVGNQIWDPAHDAVTMLPLRALPRADALDLLKVVTGAHAVPQSLRDNVLNHASGNPLMLETLGRSLAEHRLGSLSDTVEIPFTIYESVSTRLNDIRSGRRLIEALAVLDMPTDIDLLSEVADTPKAAVADAVTALVDADLVVRETVAGHARLHIPHQVYRDVIYEQIAGPSRQLLHHRSLSALSRVSDTEHPAATAHRLAQHANAAHAFDETARHALAAGESYLKRSALIEAGHYFGMARDALNRLTRGEVNDRQRLRCMTGLASIERSRFGIATDESARLGKAVADLARELHDEQAELLALNGLYAHALVRADYPLADDRAQQLFDRAQRYQNPTFTMIGTRATGAVAFHRADYPKARDCLETALGQYDRDRHLPLAHAHGYDHAEICAAFLSMTMWMQGDLDAARRMSDFSIRHAREIEHAHSLAQAMAFRMMLGSLARDEADVRAIAPEAIALCEKHGIAVMRTAALFFPVATRLCVQSAKPTSTQFAELSQGLTAFQAANPFNYGPLVATLVADIEIAAGRYSRAEEVLKAGAEAERRTGETWVAPELVRLRARLHARTGMPDAAQSLRRIALETARACDARMIALRVACDMQEVASNDETEHLIQGMLSKIPTISGAWDVLRARGLLQQARRA